MLKVRPALPDPKDLQERLDIREPKDLPVSPASRVPLVIQAPRVRLALPVSLVLKARPVTLALRDPLARPV